MAAGAGHVPVGAAQRQREAREAGDVDGGRAPANGGVTRATVAGGASGRGAADGPRLELPPVAVGVALLAGVGGRQELAARKPAVAPLAAPGRSAERALFGVAPPALHGGVLARRRVAHRGVIVIEAKLAPRRAGVAAGAPTQRAAVVGVGGQPTQVVETKVHCSPVGEGL
jgi:hypothetical protein